MSENLKEIRAEEVTIEVRDAATGEAFRRTLPISYLETAHCLSLEAEDADGKPSKLVFFTETGLRRMRDMTGGGADTDPCGGHS
ncbi:MAG: hypothetical protein Q4B42_04020 [Oscillospiraceae bacterium]|nr:hypothetical protein [Oscillospiraceae bacterium]